MCTKELAVLAAILLLVLGASVSMVSLAGFFAWFLPATPPAKSALADLSWWRTANVAMGDMQVRRNEYEERGFTVFQDVIDPKAITLLLEEAKRLCRSQLMVSKVCQIEEGRWQSDLVRDFLFYSNISAIVARLIRDDRDLPLRVYQDGILGVTSSWLQPLFFTFTKHVDHGGLPGIWGGLHSDTRGAGLWIPLVEIDPNVTGGSIELYDRFPMSGCQAAWGERSTVDGFEHSINWSKVDALCLEYREDNHTVVPAVKPGDIVAWWPHMMHRTQRVKQRDFVRYALYVRIVDNDTLVCAQKDCGWKGRPCCSLDLPTPGITINTSCYPQVYPGPLEHELQDHLRTDRPVPLLDRRRVVSKFGKRSWAFTDPGCSKYRGGPAPFWRSLMNNVALPDESSLLVFNTTMFDCERAEHEGDCWMLDRSGVKWETVPPSFLNRTIAGAFLFFSKDHDDVELMYRIPWGATIRGVREEDGEQGWIRVGDYYAKEEYFGGRLVRVGGEGATSPAAGCARAEGGGAAAEESSAPTPARHSDEL